VESHRTRKAISALENAEFADAIWECRFYSDPFPSSSRRNEERLTSVSPVAQATKYRLGMQVNTQSVVLKERIQKEPLSCKRRLHPLGRPIDANLVVVHCSLTSSGYSGRTSRSTVSETD